MFAEVGPIIPILQTRKLGLSPHGCKHQGWDLNPGRDSPCSCSYTDGVWLSLPKPVLELGVGNPVSPSLRESSGCCRFPLCLPTKGEGLGPSCAESFRAYRSPSLFIPKQPQQRAAGQGLCHLFTSKHLGFGKNDRLGQDHRIRNTGLRAGLSPDTAAPTPLAHLMTLWAGRWSLH